MALLFVGDLHLREEEPFVFASNQILDFCLENSKDGDVLVFVGDFFHKKQPTIKEMAIARVFFEKCKSRSVDVHIDAGNHEYNGAKDIFCEQVFDGFDISFYEKVHKTNFVSEDITIWFLPYISNYRLKKMGYSDVQSYVQSKYDEINKEYPTNQSKCVVVYHFEDETQFMGPDRKGVDLSFMKDIIRIGGHVHLRSDNYIGTPYATRKDESGQKCRLIKYENGEFTDIDIPEIIRYMRLSMDELKTTRFKSSVYNIIEVFDVKSTDELFEFLQSKNNLFLDNYEMLFSEDRDLESDKSDESKNTLEYLKKYISVNNVDEETSKYLLGVF